jgi:hypothetical protein
MVFNYVYQGVSGELSEEERGLAQYLAWSAA